MAEYKTETMLEKVKEVILKNLGNGMHGIRNTRNFVGDTMTNLLDEGGVVVDICYDWEYFEVFGLSQCEFEKLEEWYNNQRKY